MPTSFRSSAGPSRRNLQQQQEHSSTPSPLRSRTTNTVPNRAGSIGSSTRRRLASGTRQRSSASTTAVAPVHATSAAPAVEFSTNANSTASNSNIISNLTRSSIASEDLRVATLNALGDWTGGILGLANYFPTAGLWNDDLDDEYEEEYEEDHGETDFDTEADEEEDEDDGLDDEEDFDDFDDQDADFLTLGEEESLFLEDDFFLGGDEEGDSLLTQGFQHHHALLDLLIGEELSSPSSYPSLSHDPSWHLGLDPPSRTSPSAGTRPGRTAAQRSISPPSPSRTTTQQTNLTNDSVLITDEEEEGNTPNTSFSDDMPPTTRRGSHQSQRLEPPSKRRRTSAARRPSTGTGNKLEPIKLDDDGLFSDTPVRKPTEDAVDDLPTLDLTNATEVPEELQPPRQDNRIKLAAFQCVICMDDVTNLTVTHCGHLYCAECLHSSIHSGATKGRCPMCRQKLEIKPRENYTTKTKGHWSLELKVMTSTRKGKRKAGA